MIRILSRYNSSILGREQEREGGREMEAKLLTDELIPVHVECRVLRQATLHHVGTHITARQHVVRYTAAGWTSCHPGQGSCAIRRRLAQLRPTKSSF